MSISFIIPVYNTNSELFSNCIESILKADMKDFEIIIIDDGSTDENSRKYKSIIKGNKNIRYFKNQNHGVSYSRNFGIDKATKKYITFVDSDDHIIVDNINKKKMILKDDLILFEMIKGNNKKVYKFSYDNNKDSWKELLVDHIINSSVNSPCGKFYKRKFLLDNKLKFNTDYVQGEDALFNLEVINSRPSIYYYNFPIYNYQYYIDSTMGRWNKKFEQALNNRYSIFYKKNEIIKENDFQNKKELKRKLDNGFMKIIMNSYVVLLKINDREKLEKYSRKLKKERLNTKHLNFKNKIRYYTIILNSRIINKFLRIIIKIKKI